MTKLLIALASFAALFMLGCGSQFDGRGTSTAHEKSGDKESVTFILPDHFTGVIKIIEDKNGQTVSQRKGVFEVAISEIGFTKLADASFLKTWHGEAAVYHDGSTLPNGSVEMMPSSSVIAFFDLWSNADGSIYYYVGTKAGNDQIQKAAWEADEILQKQEQRAP